MKTVLELQEQLRAFAHEKQIMVPKKYGYHKLAAMLQAWQDSRYPTKRIGAV